RNRAVIAVDLQVGSALVYQVLDALDPFAVGLRVDPRPAAAQVDTSTTHEGDGVGAGTGAAEPAGMRLEVQVRAGHVTGRSHVGDELAGGYRGVEPDLVRAQVPVEAVDVVDVVDHQRFTRAAGQPAAPGAADDGTRSGSVHTGADVVGDVLALVAVVASWCAVV